MLVHTFPLPAKGFDPLNASEKTLTRHGFPPCPDHIRMPHAAAKWVKAFRHYSEFKHIVPKFKLLPHSHGLNRRIQKSSVGHVNATSENWSGSVLFIGGGDSFKWMSGSWTVPNVYPTTSSTTIASVWLGIDGDGSPDVMQAGTDTFADGSVWPWFEWFPAYPVGIDNFSVKAGDAIYLLLCATSTTTAWMSIANLTAKEYTNLSFSAPPGTTLMGNCAEAIVERPGIPSVVLPRYGEVFFDDTTAWSANGTGFDIGDGTAMFMLADDGVTTISTPTFEGDRDSFKVAYTGP
jgi:hypothetical protein